MDLVSGVPYSLRKAGPQKVYPPLAKDLRTDVLILGGGISGALMAYHLVKNNISCAIVDRRQVGMGSTSASTSLLLYGLDDPIVKVEKKVGFGKAATVYKACHEAIYGLAEIAADVNVQFEKRKSLYFTGAPVMLRCSGRNIV